MVTNIDEIIAGLGDKLQDPFYMGDGSPAPRPSTPAARPVQVDTTYADDQAAVQRATNRAPSVAQGPTTEELAEINRQYRADNTPTPELSVLRGLLREFNLEHLYDRLAPMITEEWTEDEIALEVRKMPEYQERFKVIFDREAAGLAPMTPQDVLNFERGLGERLSLYSYPMAPGENVQDMAYRFMSNDVSLLEVENRLTQQLQFAREVLEDPDNDGYAQQILGLGGNLFDIANFALDPQNTLEQVSRRLTAASVANEARQRSYNLTGDEALELAREGVTGEQAEQAFGQLRNDYQVVNALIGDAADPISRETELAAVAGDVEARAAIERQRERRLAAFSQGGGFATDDEGFGGIR